MSEEQNTHQFGSVGATHRLWLFFNSQVDLLEEAQGRVGDEGGDVWSVIYPLLYASVESSRSFSLLAQSGKVRDSFVLARTVFETIVNACFICARGKSAAQRAKRHAQQKSYRDLDRELEISSKRLALKWSGRVDPSEDRGLKMALNDFTGKKGREITSWTPETVKARIQVVDAKYGPGVATGLQFALFAIYRHASEIAHGTFFGALFTLGLTSPAGPAKSPNELANHQRQNISMLLMILGMAISSLIVVLGRELSLEELASKSKAAVNELRKEPWVKS